MKVLVVDDKWLARLAADVQGEVERAAQALTGRVRQLGERYATPLPRLAAEVECLTNRVDAHLRRMGAMWNSMQDLLTGQQRLPGFDAPWRRCRLRELGTFTKGKGIKRDDVVEEGIPCVRYGEIYTRHNDYIRRFYSHIPPRIARGSQRLRRGDLLFAASGETAEEIGKCVAFLGDEVAYAGGDIVILTPDGQNSIYLGYLLNQPSIAQQKARMGQGDAVVHIGARQLGTLELHVPDIAEQNAIAAVLSDMDAEIAALEQRLTETRALKQGMMQELLTGRTRLAASTPD